MFTTILIAVLLLFGLAVLVFGLSIDGVNLRPYGLIPLVAGLVILAFSVTAIVEAKNIGVVTSFGKPVGTKSSGLAFKAPWQKLTEIDGTVDTNEYFGESGIQVRTGDGGESVVYTTIRWRITPDKADTIYADYRSDNPTESFRKAVISTQFKAAVQAVLSKYNPIAQLEVVDGVDATQASQLSFAPDYDQIADDLKTQMRERLGDDPLAEIVDVTVSGVTLSKSTQKTINDFTAEIGRTRNAQQAKNTAEQQARANDALSASVSNNPGVLQSRCLDSLTNAIESGYQLPAGFSCFGSSSAVVVPSGR